VRPFVAGIKPAPVARTTDSSKEVPQVPKAGRTISIQEGQRDGPSSGRIIPIP
jgi:hypothetical protein